MYSGESNEGISSPIVQLLKLRLHHIERTRLFANRILCDVYDETISKNGLYLMIVRQASGRGDEEWYNSIKTSEFASKSFNILIY